MLFPPPPPDPAIFARKLFSGRPRPACPFPRKEEGFTASAPPAPSKRLNQERRFTRILVLRINSLKGSYYTHRGGSPHSCPISIVGTRPGVPLHASAITAGD